MPSKRPSGDGAFVDSDATQRFRRPKYTMEEWHTLTHDVELLEHPEKPIFKDDRTPSEVELHEIHRLRRMEHDLSGKVEKP